MSVNNQQITQSIKIIEEQLAILKQAIGGVEPAQEGIVGIFDGEFMMEENGKRHQVPPNYASKTMLVPGDTVRMIEDANGGQTKYKQIGKVERSKSSGILVRKDGKYEVLTEEGSFKVISAAIKHYNGEIGDQVFIQYPKQHGKGSWAAVEKVVNQAGAATAVDTPLTLPDVQPVLASSTPASAIDQPTSIAHAAQDHAAVAAEGDTTAIAEASADQPSPAPKKPAEAKPTSSTKSKSKASAKPRKSGPGTSGKSGSGSPAKAGESRSPEVAPVSKPKAPEEAPVPVNVETAFSDDDLI